MRRREFTTALSSATAVKAASAQEQAKQHRIAIIIPAGPIACIDDTGNRFRHAFWEELRGLGDVEGQNLSVERYSGEGRPEGFADLARQAVDRNPDVVVASTEAVARAARSQSVAANRLDRRRPDPGGIRDELRAARRQYHWVIVFAGLQLFGKRLQMLKEAVPSTSKVFI